MPAQVAPFSAPHRPSVLARGDVEVGDGVRVEVVVCVVGIEVVRVVVGVGVGVGTAVVEGVGEVVLLGASGREELVLDF